AARRGQAIASGLLERRSPMSRPVILGLFLCGLTLPSLGPPTRADVHYVSPATASPNPGNDSHNGTSWTDAGATITRGLALADADTSGQVEIWVRSGTYAPDDYSGSGLSTETFDFDPLASGTKLLVV